MTIHSFTGGNRCSMCLTISWLWAAASNQQKLQEVIGHSQEMKQPVKQQSVVFTLYTAKTNKISFPDKSTVRLNLWERWDVLGSAEKGLFRWTKTSVE